MHKRPDGYYRRVAEVMNLRDGDTIDVDLPNLPGVAIRLSGFNAPELDDPGGEEAAEFVANLFETTPLDQIQAYIEPPADLDKDGRLELTDIVRAAKFGRVPGSYFLFGYDLRILMLEAGHGTVDDRYKNEFNNHLWDY